MGRKPSYLGKWGSNWEKGFAGNKAGFLLFILGGVYMGLFNPAWKNKNPDKRRRAVKKLSDQAILTDIAKNDGSVFVREAAVEELNDQKVLVCIAKSDKDYRVYEAALKNLTDQNLLMDIATTNDILVRVQEMAIQKITDNTVLVDVAKKTSCRAAPYAIDRLNQTSLEDFINFLTIDNDADMYDSKPMDDGCTFTQNEKYRLLFSAALRAELISQYALAQRAYAYIAKNSTIEDTIREAVEMLNDQSALADLLKNKYPDNSRLSDKEWSILAIVTRKISDVDILTEVAKRTYFSTYAGYRHIAPPSIKDIACERLDELNKQ